MTTTIAETMLQGVPKIISIQYLHYIPKTASP